jgi:APA family basic amino acid/polyamine antiporter
VVQSITFVLNFFTVLAVLGVFLLRIKMPHAERKYKATGYPVTPLIFLIPTGWTMYILTKNLLEKFKADFFLVNGIVVIGIVVYLIDRFKANKNR